MTGQHDPLAIALWARDIEDLDREIGRMALLCRVKLLDPGVIDRILRDDASVCRSDNPVAFTKLRYLLIMYFSGRRKAAEALGQVQTARIEAHVIEQLRTRFADVLGEGPLA
jgi:hypothetical protein